MRKPPELQAVADAAPEDKDAFVRESKPSKAPRAKKAPAVETSRAKGVVKRADGSEARRLVVYLPPEIMQRLRMRCAEHEVNLSTAASEAFTQWLGV
jgi:hypothetical protein